jgi:uncharacterized protein (UPF0276 family)
MASDFPFLGHGIGLRPPHYPRVLDGALADWFEVITENFTIRGGRPLAVLERVRAERPVVLHGVSLSLGGTDPLDRRHLDAIAALAARIEPAWVSEHLCWGSHGGVHAHDLLPLPYTEEALGHVAARVARVQERLGRRILIENVSSYVTFAHSTMSEAEFVAAVAERADCGILLDVNNVFVSARNHGFDPYAYLAAIPPARVGQLHLAGHTDCGTHLLDSHDAPVCDPVWALYRAAVRRFGAVSTLIERDDRIPPVEEVLAEAEQARALMDAELDGGRVAGAVAR